MKKIVIFICFVLIAGQSFGQFQRTTNPKFGQKIDGMLSETVPFMYVTDLEEKDLDEIILLDARELEEYEVSHIPNAKYIGYDNPEFTALEDLDPDTEVIVYCSIGYRSEKIAEKLKDRGFSNVYNLYGSIFEWINQGNEIEDNQGEPTTKIHTYNKRWSKWMINDAYQKVW